MNTEPRTCCQYHATGGDPANSCGGDTCRAPLTIEDELALVPVTVALVEIDEGARPEAARPEWSRLLYLLRETAQAEGLVEALIPRDTIGAFRRSNMIALASPIEPAYLGQYTGDLGLILELAVALGEALAGLPARVPFTGVDATDRVRALALVGFEVRLRVLARTVGAYLGQAPDHVLNRAGNLRRFLARYVDEADDENRLADLGIDPANLR